MSDADRHPRAGDDLLAAYRAHTGPTPEVEARLLAALRRDTAPSDMSQSTGTSGHVASDMSQVIALRPRRWLPGAILAVAAVVIAALAIGAGLGERRAREQDPAAVFQGAPETAGTATPRPPPPVVEPAATPPIREPIREPRTRREPVIEPGPPQPSLAEEMQRMRPAQQALAAGDPLQALAELEAYAQAFPDGRLREEHLALRAIARCQAAQAGAADEAAGFLVARPQSMFAERVRTACAAR